MLLDPFASQGQFTHIRAVTLDGQTYINNTVGNITPSFPASSAYGFVSYWYSGITQNGDMNTILAVNNAFGQSVVWVGHQKINNNLVLHVTISADNCTSWIDYIGSTVLPSDGNWHNIIIYWDASGSSISYMIDGVNGTSSVSNAVGGSFTVTYTGKKIQVGVNETINTPTFTNGSIAEFFFYVPASAINLATAYTKFIDTQDLAPMYLGTNGNAPFGTPPQVFLWGDKDLFLENLTHYSQLPLVLDLSNEPTSTNIFQVTGTLKTPTTDPFQKTSPAMV